MKDIEQLREAMRRELGEIEAPDAKPHLMKRARRRRAVSVSGTGVAAVAVLGVFALALGSLLPLGDNDRSVGPAGPPVVGPSTDAIPDMAVITCTDGKPVVETPTVQTRVDGVHLLTPSSSPVMQVRLHPVQPVPGPDGVAWTEDNKVDPNAWIAGLAPGDYLAVCDPDSSFSTHEVTSGQVPSAPLTIVDPSGFYMPFVDLACADPETISMVGIPSPEPTSLDDAGAILRRIFVGIRADDQIVKAGYGTDPAYPGWQSLAWQILREGQGAIATVIARTVAGENQGFEISVCPSSGIRVGDDAASLGPPEATPRVAPPASAELRLISDVRGPDVMMGAGSGRVHGLRPSTLCWGNACGTVDYATAPKPPQVVLAQGATLKVESDTDGWEITLDPVGNGHADEFALSHASFDAPKGVYVMSVTGHWPQGTVTYRFEVELT